MSQLKTQIKKRILEKKALYTTYESESGAILRADMADRIESIVYQLANGFKTLSHIEMIALASQLKAIIDTSSLLVNAKISLEDLQEQMEDTN